MLAAAANPTAFPLILPLVASLWSFPPNSTEFPHWLVRAASPVAALWPYLPNFLIGGWGALLLVRIILLVIGCRHCIRIILLVDGRLVPPCSISSLAVVRPPGATAANPNYSIGR